MWDNSEELPWIATVVTSLIAGGGLTQLVSLWNETRHGKNIHTRELHAQMIEGLTTIADAARIEAEAAQQRARLLDDYAHQLREHISAGLPPPPPDWPTEL